MHAVAASTLFLTALVVDAITATETLEYDDRAPSSLRGTCLILGAMFASPVLVQHDFGIWGTFQRPVILVLLLAAGLAGEHHGSEQMRIFDSIFILVAGGVGIWVFSAGGVDEQAKRIHSPILDKAVQTSATMLSVSMLLVVSIRQMRSGFAHSRNVVHFQVQDADGANATLLPAARGYAMADDVVTTVTVLAGAVGIGASLVASQHVHTLQRGMNIVAPSFAVAGMVQFVCAFVLTCRFGTQATELPALFGVDACTAPGDACRVARASRRFASVNSPAASLWISSIGLFLLAVPPHTRQVYRFWTGSLSSLFFFTSLGIVAVYFCTFEGPSWQTDYVVLLTIFAAYWIRDVDVVTGIAVYLAAYVWQLVAHLELYTVDEWSSQLTQQMLAAQAILLCLYALARTSYWVAPPTTKTSIVDAVLAILATMGTSIVVGLHLLFAVALASTSGDVPEDRTTHYRNALLSSWQHFFPLLIWAPLYSDDQLGRLSTLARLAVWIVVLPLALGTYALVLSTLTVPPPALDYVLPSPFYTSTVAALAGWLAFSLA